MNPHESSARSAKATKLANAIHAAGIVAEDAAICKLGNGFWLNAAQLAECEPPHSETTVAEVILKLREIEAMEARVATHD